MTENDGQLVPIPICKIKVSNNNARTIDQFMELDDLAASIKEHGLQQPIVVFPIAGQTDTYELIIGQRRFLACKNILKKETIPAIILKKSMNSVDALAYSFIENIHRRELDYKDKTDTALKLLKDLKTPSAVAKKIGVSETTVRNYLGYAIVPERIKTLVETKKLSRDTAVRIARTNPDEERAVAIAAKIKEEPRRDVRNQIIQTAIDHPTYTPEKIFTEAPKLRFKQVTIDLSDQASIALEKASKKFEKEPEQIATEVLIDYLKAEGFY